MPISRLGEQGRGACSIGRVQPVEPTGPAEHAFVGGHKAVPAERGSNDQAIGGVGMEFGKSDCPDADLSVHRDFDQSLFQ